jgi:hypothetical protein
MSRELKIDRSRLKKQSARILVSWLFFVTLAIGIDWYGASPGKSGDVLVRFVSVVMPPVRSLLLFLSGGKAYGVPLLFATGSVAAYFISVIPTVIFYRYLGRAPWFRSAETEHKTDRIAAAVLAVTLLIVVLGTSIELVRPDPNTDPNSLREKAEMGDSMAQFRLGRLYSDGHGVQQNYSEAAKWLRMAADQGNGPAEDDLAALYYAGHGVKQDYAEFYFWESLFLKNAWGPEAEDHKILLKKFADRLPAEQKAEIDKRLIEWKPKKIPQNKSGPLTPDETEVTY